MSTARAPGDGVERSGASWLNDFDGLPTLDPLSKQIILDHAVRKQIPKGTVIFRPGDACANFPFVVAGAIRVQRLAENGKEFVLYRVSAGETCILTTAALLAEDCYAVEGVAETDVLMHILSADCFNGLMGDSKNFRSIVFDGYGRRIAALMARIEEIVCVPIGVRLAERLLELGAAGDLIIVTQQSLAADLATAREVVGRMLKQFETEGWIRLGRGEIELLDRRGLMTLVQTKKV